MKNFYNPLRFYLSLLLFGSFLNIPFSKAQTSLVAGDIAFSGYNSEISNDDDFAFILLKNVAENTIINFTDFGWTNANAFQPLGNAANSTGSTSDGAITWKATSALSAGTQIRIRCTSTLIANYGTVTPLQASSGDPSLYMSLAVGGDQIFAFQGSLASPTLIAGLNMNGNWDASVTPTQFSGSVSMLPAALGNTYALAIAPEVDNAVFDGNYSITNYANVAAFRTALMNAANWAVNDVTPFTLPYSNGTLPVRSGALAAKLTNEGVALNWITYSETNNNYFKLERANSENVFQELAIVAAKSGGNATVIQHYEYVDKTPANGYNYYKLSQYDDNGTATLIGYANINTNLQSAVMVIYPNPVKSSFKIKAAKLTGTYQIKVFNSNGNVVYNQTLNANNGELNCTFKEKPSTGIYTVALDGYTPIKIKIE